MSGHATLLQTYPTLDSKKERKPKERKKERKKERNAQGTYIGQKPAKSPSRRVDEEHEVHEELFMGEVVNVDMVATKNNG